MVMGKVSQFSIVWHSYTMRDIGEGIFKVVTLLGSNFSFTLASDSPVSLFSPLSLFSSLIYHHLQIYMDHTPYYIWGFSDKSTGFETRNWEAVSTDKKAYTTGEILLVKNFIVMSDSL